MAPTAFSPSLALLLFSALLAATPTTVTARTVNISSTWFLPQEEFPVFYRYFRDRITWFEADAVCQFHHANLVTVDTSVQFDTTRAYLKELDVVTNVWIGLKKGGPADHFAWTDYKPLAHESGYWLEQIPKSGSALCAALDPAADYRWHSLNCGGPEVASFICELPVPPWARKEDGCMPTALPSLTVTFLPEQAAVELTSDCGLDGTRRIACKGQANHDEMMKQLSCDHGDGSQEDDGTNSSSSTPGISSSLSIDSMSSNSVSSSSIGISSGTRAWSWDESHEPPTRHRRDADDASSLMLAASDGAAPTRAYEPTTTVVTASQQLVDASTAPPPVPKEQAPSLVYTGTDTVVDIHPPYLISTVVIDTNKTPQLNTMENLNLNTNHEELPMIQQSTATPTTLLPQVETIKPIINIHLPSLNGDIIMSEQLQDIDSSNTNNAIQPTPQKKDLVITENITSTSAPAVVFQSLTPASPAGVVVKPVPSTNTGLSENITTDPVVVVNINTNPTNRNVMMETSQVKNTTETVVVVPAQTKESIPQPITTTIPPTTTTAESNVTTTTEGEKTKLLSPVFDDSKSSEEADEQRRMKDQEEIRRRQFLPTPLRAVPDGNVAKSENVTGTTKAPVEWAPIEEEGEVVEEEQEEPVEPVEPLEPIEPEPEIPARPNRGRRLTRPAQGHTFYPYFLNRVLG